jgi:hypothetical protein
VGAAPVPGQDVVQGEIARLLAAVLAHEVVSQEHIAAGEAALGPRAPDQVDKANDRGDLELRGGAVQVAAAVFDDFRFAAVKQDESPAYVTYVQWLIVLVQ